MATQFVGVAVFGVEGGVLISTRAVAFNNVRAWLCCECSQSTEALYSIGSYVSYALGLNTRHGAFYVQIEPYQKL